jgi:type II secretory pathway pseudopilin PulG
MVDSAKRHIVCASAKWFVLSREDSANFFCEISLAFPNCGRRAPLPETDMFCSNCGSATTASARFCAGCGESRDGSQADVIPTGRRAHSRDLYQAVIGPKRRDYYLSRFSRYAESGKAGVSWHWPAFFVTLYWLMYRKMWLYAALYLFVPYVSLVVGSGVVAGIGDATGTTELLKPVGLAIWIVAFLIAPPLLANSLYFSHCTDKINEVAATASSKERQIGELSVKGGTSNVLVHIVAATYVTGTVGILAAAAIPAYQNYANTAKLQEAEGFGLDAAKSVEAYYLKNDRIPATLEETGFAARMPSAVSHVSFSPEDGAISIRVKAADPAIDGRSLILVPSLDDEQKFVWTCLSRDIEASHLPLTCRASEGA